MVERRAGAILNVGSAAGNMPIPNNATYAATKAFANACSESLRGELAEHRIGVSAICPGIVDTNIAKLNARMADRRIRVEVTDAGKEWLARAGFDPVYGARPLRRQIQTTIEDQLARRVLAGQVTEGSTVTFDGTEDGDGLRIL